MQLPLAAAVQSLFLLHGEVTQNTEQTCLSANAEEEVTAEETKLAPSASVRVRERRSGFIGEFLSAKAGREKED